MTFLAIVSAAAVCASLVWWERRIVSGLAMRRCAARRQRRPWDTWDDLLPGGEDGTKRLTGAIETAIFAGDFAFAHRARLDPKIAKGESPFQFRRSRIDASVRRYERAVGRAMVEAHSWMAVKEGRRADPGQLRSAVERMVRFLEQEGARAPSAGNMAGIDITIDVLENALANLRRRPEARGVAHPFR